MGVASPVMVVWSLLPQLVPMWVVVVEVPRNLSVVFRSNLTMRCRLVSVVVLLVPVPLQPLGMVDYQILMRVFAALVVLAHFSHNGRFVMFSNLGDQESGLLCPPSYVELQDLILRQYYFLCPKFLHEAPVELEDAIFDSLHIVRCHS